VKRAVLPHPTDMGLITTDLSAADGYGTNMGPRNHDVPLVKSQQHIIDPANRAALSTIASSTGCTSVASG